MKKECDASTSKWSEQYQKLKELTLNCSPNRPYIENENEILEREKIL